MYYADDNIVEGRRRLVCFHYFFGLKRSQNNLMTPFNSHLFINQIAFKPYNIKHMIFHLHMVHGSL